MQLYKIIWTAINPAIAYFYTSRVGNQATGNFSKSDHYYIDHDYMETKLCFHLYGVIFQKPNSLNSLRHSVY